MNYRGITKWIDIRVVTLTATACLATALLPAVAKSSNHFTIDNKIFLSDNRAGASSAITIDFSHRSTNPEVVPPSANRMKVLLPRGVKFNPEVVDACPTEIFTDSSGRGCDDSLLGGSSGTCEVDARELNLAILGCEAEVFRITTKPNHVMDIGIAATLEGMNLTATYQFYVVKEGGQYILSVDSFGLPPGLGRIVLTHGRFAITGKRTKKVKVKVKSKKKSGKKSKRNSKFITSTVTERLITNSRDCPSSGSWTYEVSQGWDDGSNTVTPVPVPCKPSK